MLFNSPIYIFAFLPIVFCTYVFFNHTLKNRDLAKSWLVLASLFFYGYWNPVYLLLLGASITVNFKIGRQLQLSYSDEPNTKQSNRKRIAILGVVFNGGLLAYFKYFDFFIENVNWVSGGSLDLLNIALPLAISFFTFQQIAFLIDCYKEKTKIYSLLDYSLFVTFFPQLIAGPIVHHKQMMPQFSRESHTSVKWENIATGITIFFIGLFKKVVIADTFAIWADIGFNAPDKLNFFEAWATSLSYSFQLYYDFSGYTDMAIGAALLFNIKLPINFNSPYKALNIQDFWRRWHITLSNWLRDYVYIPLGGNKKGRFATYQNLFLTFLIGGLWHGAGWTFIVWGALHGSALVIHRLWNQANLKLPPFAAWLTTFVFVNIAWIFFRADNLEDAITITRALVDIDSIAITPAMDVLIRYLSPFPLPELAITSTETFLSIHILSFLVIFGIASFLAPNSMQIARYIPYKGMFHTGFSLTNSVLVALIGALSLVTFAGDVTPAKFLYFNF